MRAQAKPKKTLKLLSESEIIAAIGRLKCSHQNRLSGDDIGSFQANGQVFAATDSLIEGIHYRDGWLSPRDIAYKLFARNYSDFAVKGAKPRYALCNLALRAAHASESFVTPFLRELDRLFTRFGITLTGGDTSRAQHDHFTLSFFGSARRFVPRAARQLKAGDIVFQIGRVGGSDAARALIETGAQFQAKDIRAFARPGFLEQYSRPLYPIAAIDQSDSVQKTLQLLAEANSAELEIELDQVQTARSLGAVNEANALQVLGAAEDLAVFGIVPGGGKARTKSAPAFRPIGRVKYIHRARARVLYNLNGRKFEHHATTFEHFA